MMEKSLYFAYGSNINLDQMQYLSKCYHSEYGTDQRIV